MRFAIITTTVDTASMNIKDNLLTEFSFNKLDINFDGFPVYEFENSRLYTTDKAMITYENIDDELPEKYDLIIFASKHRSGAGVPSLTIHSLGNWNDAQYGGEEKTLCIAQADYMQFAYSMIKKFTELEKLMGFDIVQEVTHHGPYLRTPCMFIEVGSDENGWKNPLAGKIIAKTIMHIISNEVPKYDKVCIGIGGTHYAQNFSKRAEFSNWAFGHIIPKHQLEFMDGQIISSAIKNTRAFGVKNISVAVDWKSVGPFKDKIRSIAKELNMEFEMI